VLGEPGAQRGQLEPGLLRLAVELLAGADQAALRSNQLVQTKDRLNGLVHLGLLALEQPAQLRVRQERPVDLQRPLPAERVYGLLGLPGQLGVAGRAGQVVARLPDPGDLRRPGLPVDSELHDDARIVTVVQVPPAVPPHRGPAGPALVVAGQRELDGLGEARLARAVPAGDDRQPRPGR
jgi:hypothetical protein